MWKSRTAEMQEETNVSEICVRYEVLMVFLWCFIDDYKSSCF